MLPPALVVTVRFTVYVPGEAYVCEGFCSVLSIESSLSKSQAQAVMPSPLDSSVNWTVRGASPEVGVAVKSATGRIEELWTLTLDASEMASI